MKLKQKLIIVLAVTFIVPCLLYYVCTRVMGFAQMSRLNSEFGMEVHYIQYMTGLYREVIDEVTDDLRDEVEKTAEESPGKLMDPSYLGTINERLGEKSAFLVVLKNGEVVYGQPTGDVLRCVRKTQTDEKKNTWYANQNLFVRGVAFSYADGGFGQAYFVTDVSTYVDRYFTHIARIVMVVLITLSLTVAILAIVMYRSIYKPILELRAYTKLIAEGDLDHQIFTNRTDEIGELYHDFEIMRRKLQESALEQIRNEADGKVLISNISHDLKTPITSIKGYIEGIMDGVADTPEKMDRYIHTIHNKANDMEHLIEELTFYSKINTNKIPYTFAKIDLSDYFEDCVEEIAADLDAEGISFDAHNDFAGEGVLVIADPEQLKKVINNIISNAVKYMDKEEPRISMRLLNKPEPEWVTVEIEDNGKGMAKQDLPRIFERFYRTDSARSSTTGGSGIGLSICRKIMNDHGGTIGADSTEGLGTIMRFSLKKYKEDEHE